MRLRRTSLAAPLAECMPSGKVLSLFFSNMRRRNPIKDIRSRSHRAMHLARITRIKDVDIAVVKDVDSAARCSTRPCRAVRRSSPRKSTSTVTRAMAGESNIWRSNSSMSWSRRSSSPSATTATDRDDIAEVRRHPVEVPEAEHRRRASRDHAGRVEPHEVRQDLRRPRRRGRRSAFH